ncbi:hypothetical protein EXIGLDRAFT_612872 [Exidia glandulosa HHB12029]|uniref:MARVEL domain-containing protein n=1 Tax=Exidia glandulosa HHB12029 TaxID=1314781 RepID=A0A165IK49_EXIGL|nr:hypothetical protein EXIGLDRAFT_612872 [Exidia glandulosa HHB12029]
MLNQLRRSEKQPELPRTSEEQLSSPVQPPETGGSYFPDPPQRQTTQQLRLQIPRNANSFTLAQSKTPGWSTPWAPSRPNRAYLRAGNALGSPSAFDELPDEKHGEEMSSWKRRRRGVRNFVLTNGYVPLMIRLLNFSFTTATLGVAIRLRHIEITNNLLGAVGSSPILAIIFSPLTLAHVLIAIYLEYFGRPLGLWRTSGKLAHTLSEVLFICIWSGSFSVAVDNYFTSPLLCTPANLNAWWNHLPPQGTPIVGTGRHEGGVADLICDDQLAIVFLEFVGLCLYCGSLVISLYRIFEKVKIHTTANNRSYA